MRVNAEEKQCVKVLKRMLGEDVFANYGIIVITKGDACKENCDTPIRKWLKSEEFFKVLLKECGERCVLFENKTADPIVKIEQRVLLFHYIDKLGGKVFSSGLFELAKKTRSNLLIKKGFSENEDNTFRTNCDEIEHGMYSTLGKSFTKQEPSVGHLIQCLHEVLKDICHIDHLVALDVEKENCFPKGSSVLLENGRKEIVENLSPGIEVLTFDKKKSLVYAEIYMFGHKQGNTVSKFVVIHTESHQISISPEHLILCKKNDMKSFVAAKTVKVGDEILTKSEQGFVWSSVADVTYSVDRGLYAPFTKSGTIVVDGVVASCYIDVLLHDVCHRMVSPIRCLYRVSPSLVRRDCGVSDTQPVPNIARLALTVLGYG
ncbi:uncharacterized protein LOC131950352 [Physella acuta]|uniref:uncharacterized protein LOC131950352 n=1 Tax=Physella acuta TaxID=109671 RepID=UPI0027DE2C90|nr:uncharacterized protein LOC131950352 [Physella acuta]